MATGSYLSIITLNINGLNAPTKRQRLAERIKKKKKTIPLYMLSTRDPPQNRGHIQTESDIPCKQRVKESNSSNSHIRKKNRL